MAEILVMEDDDLIRSLMERILESEGHQVCSFSDAAPALDTVDFSQMDLIITDLIMPTSGEQAIRWIRKNGHTVPILVLSGYITGEKAVYLKNLGAQAIMPKPFNLEELLGVVGHLL